MRTMLGSERIGKAWGRKGLALLVLVSMLFSGMTVAAAGSPNDIAPSEPRYFVQIPSGVQLISGNSKEMLSSSEVLMLVSKTTYISGTETYYCVFYKNSIWSVAASSVSANILGDAAAQKYMIDTFWSSTNYVSVNDDTASKGDMRTASVQWALSILGYYSGVIDGNFGSGSETGTRNFQKANGLKVDGRAGPATQALLFSQATKAYNSGNVGNWSGTGTGTTGTTGGSTGVVNTTGTLTTTDSVNLRKTASTKSARLAVVPKKYTLNYIDATVVAGVTWYRVTYASNTGWVMGTFTSLGGGGTSGGGGTVVGTVTITMPGTRVRKTADGVKTGTVLAKGTVVSLMGSAVTAGGYSWYPIQTAKGLNGYVRGDCATASMGGGGTVTPSTGAKTYIRLISNLNLFTQDEKPSSGFTTVGAGAVLQLVNTTTYTKNNVQYCSVYYNNKSYNAVYADVQGSIMTEAQLTTYIVDTLWRESYKTSLKEELNLVGDINVHSAQYALSILGFYNGVLDGNFGGGTASAVRNFQRKNSLTVDGSIGPKTWVKLFPMAITAYSATSGGGTSGGGGGSAVVTEFGTIKSIEKATWDYGNQGANMFPKSSSATVMDTQTGKVFKIVRWSGGNHADCVPASAADTKVMCDIVGFSYNSSHPNSTQLTKIIGDSKNNNATYAWPDFSGKFGGKGVGSDWDRRPALLNVDGRVFCVSIYGWPHGYNDYPSFPVKPSVNNYYGMMCIHFVDSRTHGGNSPDSKHQDAINVAYKYAKDHWPSLCK